MEEVSSLAIVQKRASDLTGVEGPDTDFCTVVVRSFPGLDRSVRLDVLPSEIKDLKSAGDIVQLEVKNPNGEVIELVVTLAELKKVAPNIEKIVQAAPGTRGRVPGFSPKVANGG